MPKFKDYLESDIDTFINIDEFGTVHNIDGRDIKIQLDNDQLKQQQLNSAEGTFQGDMLFLVQKSVYGPKPSIGRVVKFDSKTYMVSDCQEDEGLYTITLVANRA
jgi:hypothetical protein